MKTVYLTSLYLWYNQSSKALKMDTKKLKKMHEKNRDELFILMPHLTKA